MYALRKCLNSPLERVNVQHFIFPTRPGRAGHKLQPRHLSCHAHVANVPCWNLCLCLYSFFCRQLTYRWHGNRIKYHRFSAVWFGIYVRNISWKMITRFRKRYIHISSLKVLPYRYTNFLCWHTWIFIKIWITRIYLLLQNTKARIFVFWQGLQWNEP